MSFLIGRIAEACVDEKSRIDEACEATCRRSGAHLHIMDDPCDMITNHESHVSFTMTSLNDSSPEPRVLIGWLTAYMLDF